MRFCRLSQQKVHSFNFATSWKKLKRRDPIFSSPAGTLNAPLTEFPNRYLYSVGYALESLNTLHNILWVLIRAAPPLYALLTRKRDSVVTALKHSHALEGRRRPFKPRSERDRGMLALLSIGLLSSISCYVHCLNSTVTGL